MGEAGARSAPDEGLGRRSCGGCAQLSECGSAAGIRPHFLFALPKRLRTQARVGGQPPLAAALRPETNGPRPVQKKRRWDEQAGRLFVGARVVRIGVTGPPTPTAPICTTSVIRKGGPCGPPFRQSDFLFHRSWRILFCQVKREWGRILRETSGVHPGPVMGRFPFRLRSPSRRYPPQPPRFVAERRARFCAEAGNEPARLRTAPFKRGAVLREHPSALPSGRLGFAPGRVTS